MGLKTFDAEMPPIDELVPHCGGSILLDRVVVHEPHITTVLVVAGEKRWLRRSDRSVAAWLSVEYMAQCVAAHEGMRARAEGRTLPPGVLISVTRLHIERAEFRFGERLLVSASRLRGRPGLGVLSHRCEIRPAGGGAPIATGRLSIAVERERG